MKSKIVSAFALTAALFVTGIASAQTPLRVTYYPIRDNKLILWIAQDAGFFKKNGLDLALTSEPENGEAAVKTLLAKRTDMAVLGFRDAIRSAVSNGNVKLTVIAGLGPNPFNFLASPEIKSAQDLKGKKVWTAAFGHGPDVSTRVVLKHLGLDPEKDVQLMPCEDCTATLLGKKVKGHDYGVAQILEGTVSASLSSRSTLKDLEKAGQKVTLLTDFIDAGLTITAADVVVRKDWLAANRDTAKRFLKALVEATAYTKTNREFTEAIQKKYLLKEYASGMESKFEDYVLGVLPSKPYPSVIAVDIALAEKAKGNTALKDKKGGDFVDASLMNELENEGL